MIVIVNSIMQFLPYIFMLCVMGIIVDMVISGFTKGKIS